MPLLHSVSRLEALLGLRDAAAGSAAGPLAVDVPSVDDVAAAVEAGATQSHRFPPRLPTSSPVALGRLALKRNNRGVALPRYVVSVAQATQTLCSSSSGG